MKNITNNKRLAVLSVTTGLFFAFLIGGATPAQAGYYNDNQYHHDYSDGYRDEYGNYHHYEHHNNQRGYWHHHNGVSFWINVG